jgi:mannose-6-phosphate isomerase
VSAPIYVNSNQPAARFYQGGEKIRSFRGFAAEGDRVPEDWVASTTTVFGESSTGLSELPDGRLLIDAINSDPAEWLGPSHRSTFGSDTMLLVKLLDAGQRLPVHIHPERRFAGKHLGRRHGKAEAWCILEGGTIHLGFKRNVDRKELRDWVERQDADAILGAMHAIEVGAGDSVYVPPGLPHAIGSGVFLLEVQEPEDLSILLEWKNFPIDGFTDGHLGLGFDTALEAADRRQYTEQEIQSLLTRKGTGVASLAPGSEEYFRAERLAVSSNVALDEGFSILVVTNGEGTLIPASTPSSRLAKGDTVLVPFSAGPVTITGCLELVLCRPPVPQAGRGGKWSHQRHPAWE